MLNLSNDGNVYIPDQDGNWISQNQRRVAELLKEYYHYLELQWIPPGARGPQDYAFRVIDRTPGRSPYVVCFAMEADERLLAKVYSADQLGGNSVNCLDAHNRAQEALKQKQRQEQRLEMLEFAHTVLRSRKIHFKHKGFDFGTPLGGRMN